MASGFSRKETPVQLIYFFWFSRKETRVRPIHFFRLKAEANTVLSQAVERKLHGFSHAPEPRVIPLSEDPSATAGVFRRFRALAIHDRECRMLYMVVETFRRGDPVPVYRRFNERGRMMPEGLEYRGSWVTEDLGRCFQLVECHDRSLLDRWMANWDDIVEFEVLPVITSAEALAAIEPRL